MKVRFVGGNRLQLLTGGDEFFPALKAAIAAARCEVLLETYIFADDATGADLAATLADAARRGVLVRVLADGFGSSHLPARLLPELRAAGVQAMLYRPDISPWALRKGRLRRLHRKLAVIDGRVAFIGGINIVDDAPAADLAPRHDYAVRVEGPLLAQIHPAVRRMWEVVSWANFRRRYRQRPAGEERCPTVAGRCGNATAALVLRDNLLRRRDIEESYLLAIAAARRRIVIANAYFLPGRRFRRALCEAAARGVEVTLLLQGRVEYRLQHWATQALYGQLLAAGMKIHEYDRSFLHAKVAVVDDRWATVGSSNIDPLSLLVAKEANLVSVDLRFARALRDRLDEAIAGGARPIDHADWQRYSLLQRAIRWASYQLIRLAVGITGYARGEAE
jgi:cardiolipin synthase